MKGFSITTRDLQRIRFRYYPEAPVTSAAFSAVLPFTRSFMHARVSGAEFWTNDAPKLDITQEEASVFTRSGEVVIGPIRPERAKTAGCMGIYYGEGKGLDACNVFATVVEEDFPLLQALGERIWKRGEEVLQFEDWSEE